MLDLVVKLTKNHHTHGNRIAWLDAQQIHQANSSFAASIHVTMVQKHDAFTSGIHRNGNNGPRQQTFD